MPEYPDITVYVEALEKRLLGTRLEAARIAHPFLLRSFEPPLEVLHGRRVEAVRRIGKRIAIGFAGGYWLVMHLMIAGRLHWFAPPGRKSGARALAVFEFAGGTLTLTEAGSKRRASLCIVRDEQFAAQDPGGLDVMHSGLDEFRARLTQENHTLKRALTDPRAFSGIGNAYSDEILHSARLSPLAMSARLEPAAIERLYTATRNVLGEWAERLRREAGGSFPEGVTAFRPQMAVHGRFGKPCPVCQTIVQRIRYAENETNYCPRCQTGGRLLADRALSRLLKADWPRSIEELEKL